MVESLSRRTRVVWIVGIRQRGGQGVEASEFSRGDRSGIGGAKSTAHWEDCGGRVYTEERFGSGE